MSSIQFEMLNLTSFPMEKLYFDLKLKVFEQMDVLELAKVNQEFLGMLMRDPSIVFGEHVFVIEVGVVTEGSLIRIRKFKPKQAWGLERWNCEKFNFTPLFSRLVKKIRWCDLLILPYSASINDLCTLLNNLESVNRLEVSHYSKEFLEKFYSNFHASVKEEAELMMPLNAPQYRSLISLNDSAMLVKRLEYCKKIKIRFDFYFEDLFRFYLNGLLKTQIKNINLAFCFYQDCLGSIVQRIMASGIPSKNPEAAICILSNKSSATIDFSAYPGIRRIDGEKRLQFIKQANGILFEILGCYPEWASMEGSLIFRRRIDSAKDCIYVYQNSYASDYLHREKDYRYYFVAFYVSVD